MTTARTHSLRCYVPVQDGIIGWFLGKNDDCQFLTFQTRMVMEDNTTYADAAASLTNYRPLGPAFIIIGGTEPTEGAVIAKAFNATAEEHGPSACAARLCVCNN